MSLVALGVAAGIVMVMLGRASADSAGGAGSAGNAPSAADVLTWSQADPKTFFQTSSAYDPRIAIATDAVIVHRHGAPEPGNSDAIRSWTGAGATVGRMIFADSDAGQHYTEGRWDGASHADDREMNAAGGIVNCEGRPYMFPTADWTAYLQSMARQSIAAGASALMPEEPLAHVNSGYEAASSANTGRRTR